VARQGTSNPRTTFLNNNYFSSGAEKSKLAFIVAGKETCCVGTTIVNNSYFSSGDIDGFWSYEQGNQSCY
jgi:hypothetical protein